MTKRLLPGATIGIIGAGQLGKMLAQAGQKMGYRMASLDPNPNSCAFNVSHWSKQVDFNDREAVTDFAHQVDVLTYEFENINGEILDDLSQTGRLPQGSKLLLVSQDRAKEKAWLESIGTRVVDYAIVKTWEDLLTGLEKLSYPAILKTCRFGYDGKGQIRLTQSSDLDTYQEEILAILNEQSLILEAYCPFDYELSVIIARDQLGTIKVFPASQNIHQSGVLFSSLVGKQYSHKILSQINDMAEKIAVEGELIGVCGLECFITEDQDVIINELAPRPHNSGHYSIEACSVSQFDQHILAVTGRPLMDIHLHQASLMVNILGQHMELVSEIMTEFPQAHLHIYDKGQAKQQRKMGHFTILSDQVEDLQDLLDNHYLLQQIKSMY